MKIKSLLLFVLIATYFYSGSCNKENPAPSNPCSGVTINVQGSTVSAGPSANNGSIIVSAPVGSGITYSLNGATAVSTTTFANLAAGTYTITAKNSNGCTGTATFTVTTDVCAGKNIVVSTPTIVNFTPCASSPDGSVTVAATGSTGFTYNIAGGTFQASTTFNNLAAGSYVVGAKDADGCIKTANVTIGNRPAGTLFTAVKGVIQANCVSCHGASNPSGGTSLATDCDIVIKWDRIQARAVVGTPSFMPQGGPMPISERNKITAWVNAGHRYTD